MGKVYTGRAHNGRSTSAGNRRIRGDRYACAHKSSFIHPRFREKALIGALIGEINEVVGDVREAKDFETRPKPESGGGQKTFLEE